MISSATAVIVVGCVWAAVWGYVRLMATLLPFFRDRALESRIEALEGQLGKGADTDRIKKLEAQVVDLQVAAGARSMR